MITIINTMRKQTAVYWPPTTDQYGQIIVDEFSHETFLAPIELTPTNGTGVFWKRKVELFTSAGGEQRMSKAVVFTGIDIKEGGMMMYGPISAVPNGLLNDPRRIPGAARVELFVSIPTLGGDQFVRKAYL